MNYDILFSLLSNFLIIKFLNLCLGMKVNKHWQYVFVIILFIEAIFINNGSSLISIAYFFPIIICLIYSYYCLKGSIKTKLFYILIDFLLTYSVELSAFYLVMFLIENNELSQNMGYFIKFVSKIILIIIMLIFYKITSNKRNYLISLDYKLWLISSPVVAILTILIIIYLTKTSKIDLNIMMSMLCMFILLICLLFVLMQITVSETNTKYLESVMKNNIEKQAIESYEIVKNTFEYNRKLEHDLQKHINIVKSFIVSRNYEEANAYLEKVEDMIVFSNQSFTNNRVLNYILNYNVNHTTDIKFDINITNDLAFINDVDLTSIIGNLLSNAIESTEKFMREERKIILEIYRKRNFVTIVLKNPTTLHSADIQTINTNKSNYNRHGFGLKIIKKKVEQYGGSFHISVINDMFVAKCIFCLEDDSI